MFIEGAGTTRTVAENAETGTPVGDPVAVRSVQGRTVTYSLSGTDALLFTIDEETGQIRVAPGTAFDYEGEQNTYQLNVVARSFGGATASIGVVINVTDVVLPGIAENYDTNGNECIDLDEAVTAVNDYSAGTLTLEEATAVVNLYYGCSISSTEESTS